MDNIIFSILSIMEDSDNQEIQEDFSDAQVPLQKEKSKREETSK